MKKGICKYVILINIFLIFILSGCSEKDPTKGVGPVSDLTLDSNINISLSEKGKQIFDSKCLACHNFERRVVGPPLNGITQRRKPEWIMNMIINPEEMTHKDPQAKELLKQYITPMVSQNITEDEARAMLEYFRSKDKGL